MNVLKFCVICGNKKGLKTICEEFTRQNKIKQSYGDGLFNCFQLQFLDKHFGSFIQICGKCVAKLRYCYAFRGAVEKAHKRFYNIVDAKTNVTETVRVKKDIKNYTQSTKETTKYETMLPTTVEDTDIKQEDFDYETYDVSFDVGNNDEDQENVEQSDNIPLNSLNEDSNQSNWSVDTDDILTSTGYWQELDQIQSKQRFLPPPLDKDSKKCPICSKTFTLRVGLSKHYSTHFPTHLCDICGNSYLSAFTFKNHLPTHRGLTFKCTECSKPFNTPNNMRLHYKRRHEGFKPFICYVCRARFLSSKAKRIHLVVEHNLEKEKLLCSFCDQLLLTTNDLRTHLQEMHFDKVELKCLECSLVFLRVRELNEHNVRHLGFKKYHCEFCGKDFTRIHTLKEHVKIHLNIKKYICSECNKSFVQKSALQSHIKIHCK